MNVDPNLVQLGALIFGPGGAVYLGFKFGMNGIQDDIHDVREYARQTRDEMRGLRQDMGSVRERLSTLETKQNMIHEEPS